MTSALLWLTTAPSRPQATMLRRQVFGSVNKPWQTTSHVSSQPFLITVSIILTGEYTWGCVFLGFSTSQLSPFLNQRAMCNLPLWKPVLTVGLRCDWLQQRTIQEQPYPFHTHCLLSHQSQAMLHGMALILHTEPLVTNLDALLLCDLRVQHVTISGMAFINFLHKFCVCLHLYIYWNAYMKTTDVGTAIWGEVRWRLNQWGLRTAGSPRVSDLALGSFLRVLCMHAVQTLLVCVPSINPKHSMLATCSGQRHFNIDIMDDDEMDDSTADSGMEENALKLWNLHLPS